MIHVRVDFNARARDGLLKGSQRRADGILREGMKVVVFDPDDADLRYVATVEHLDAETGRALFEVHWNVHPPVFFVRTSTVPLGADDASTDAWSGSSRFELTVVP